MSLIPVQQAVLAAQRALARLAEAASSRLPAALPPLPNEVGLPWDNLVVVPADWQLVYRVLGRPMPRERDFTSNRDKDRPREEDEPYVDFMGVSTFGTRAQAEENAVQYPKFVATVRLAPGMGFTLARTYADMDGHYTVWGNPADLVECIDGEPVRYDDPDRN